MIANTDDENENEVLLCYINIIASVLSLLS